MSALTARIMVRLEPDVRRQLEARAKAEDRKPSALARHLIRQGLQAAGKGAQGA
jgi:predicted transcriptional regulator